MDSSGRRRLQDNVSWGERAYRLSIVRPHWGPKMLIPCSPNSAWGMYCIWAGLCLVCAGMVYFLVPETARLPMEEIAELFGDTVVVHLQVDGSGAIEAPGTDAGGDNLQKLYVSEHVEEEKEEPQGKV